MLLSTYTYQAVGTYVDDGSSGNCRCAQSAPSVSLHGVTGANLNQGVSKNWARIGERATSSKMVRVAYTTTAENKVCLVFEGEGRKEETTTAIC